MKVSNSFQIFEFLQEEQVKMFCDTKTHYRSRLYITAHRLTLVGTQLKLYLPFIFTIITTFLIHPNLFLSTNHSSIGGGSDRGGNQGSPRLHRKSPHFLRGESQRLCSLEEDVRDLSFLILTYLIS